MRPTLQPRLQGSFKHGDRRRLHSMIMQVCEFDFLSLPALDHEAMCVSGTTDQTLNWPTPKRVGHTCFA